MREPSSVMNEHRSLVARIFEAQKEDPPRYKGSEVLSILSAEGTRPKGEMTPLLSDLARKALGNYLVGPADRRVKRLAKMAEEYEVDGAIHFATPACHHENAAFRLIRDAFRAKGLPVLNLEGDMTDERNYSPDQTASSLESFLEIINERSKNQGRVRGDTPGQRDP